MILLNAIIRPLMALIRPLRDEGRQKGRKKGGKE